MNKCKDCGKIFNNAKSYTNHIRYGCPSTRVKEIKQRKAREYREIANRMHKKYPQKNNARNILQYHIKNGDVIKPKVCSINNDKCNGRIEGHHEDYRKPLEVVWLCKFHHKELHQKLNNNNKVLGEDLKQNVKNKNTKRS